MLEYEYIFNVHFSGLPFGTICIALVAVKFIWSIVCTHKMVYCAPKVGRHAEKKKLYNDASSIGPQ